jgi:hypothetical protein
MSHFRTGFSLASAAAIVVAGSALAAIRVEAQQSMPMAMPTVAIESPSSGAIVTGTSFPVVVKASNFKIECADVGKPATPSVQGHVHAMVDGMNMEHLANMYCLDRFSISTAGLKPGKHMLTVVLANDAHQMDSTPVSVPFTYAPTAEQPLPQSDPREARVTILSPKNGESVERKFDVKLAVTGFHESCDLEGRPNVPGYGHLHVFVTQPGITDKTAQAPMVAMMQTPSGKMIAERLAKETGMSMDQVKSMASMAMVGMQSMPCASTIPVDLTTWQRGPARVMIMLANDDHEPTTGVAPAAITVNVK